MSARRFARPLAWAGRVCEVLHVRAFAVGSALSCLALSGVACGALLDTDGIFGPAIPDGGLDASTDAELVEDSDLADGGSDYFVDDFPATRAMNARWQREAFGPAWASMRLAQTAKGLEITPTTAPGDNRTGYKTVAPRELRDSHISVFVADRGGGPTNIEIAVEWPPPRHGRSFLLLGTGQIFAWDLTTGPLSERGTVPEGGLTLELRHTGTELEFAYEQAPGSRTVFFRTPALDVSESRFVIRAGGDFVANQSAAKTAVLQHFVFAHN